MSSREIAVDMGVYPDNLEEGHETDSLALGLAHSHTQNPEDPVRFSDLVHLGRTTCWVIMTQRGTRHVCGHPKSTCTRKLHLGMGNDRRGEPGYYVGYYGRDGSVDGVAGQVWDKDEALALRGQAMTDHVPHVEPMGPPTNHSGVYVKGGTYLYLWFYFSCLAFLTKFPSPPWPGCLSSFVSYCLIVFCVFAFCFIKHQCFDEGPIKGGKGGPRIKEDYSRCLREKADETAKL